MNIFETAKKMELDGEAFYNKLAKKSNNLGDKSIFNFLASQERDHYLSIKALEGNGKGPLQNKNILEKADNIFEKLKKENTKIEYKLSQIELYKQAQDIETQSINFYKNAAVEETDQYQKEIFLQLTSEEEEHYETLGNIIRHIDRTSSWVEAAEFTNKDEEY